MNKQTAVKATSVADALDEIDTQTLHGAMALAFAEIEAASKSADNPFFNSKYADLTSIIGTVKPALIKHRLFFTQHCHPAPDGISVETVLHHANGESLSLGTLFVPANKRDPQGFGSALTYARRYGLQTAFGVPTEDDDGNAAVKATANPTTGETPPKKRVPLDGPYTCRTQLQSAAKEFVRSLESMSEHGELLAWLDTKDIVDFREQLKRDLPAWAETGEGLPPEFVPLEERIASKKRELENMENA